MEHPYGAELGARLVQLVADDLPPRPRSSLAYTLRKLLRKLRQCTNFEDHTVTWAYWLLRTDVAAAIRFQSHNIWNWFVAIFSVVYKYHEDSPVDMRLVIRYLRLPANDFWRMEREVFWACQGNPAFRPEEWAQCQRELATFAPRPSILRRKRVRGDEASSDASSGVIDLSVTDLSAPGLTTIGLTTIGLTTIDLTND